jgi:hypothetical protein
VTGAVPRLRATRRSGVTTAVATAWFGAVLLRSDDAFSGTVDRILLAGYVAVLLAGLALPRAVPAWRRSALQLAAMREHRDPGPELREGTDAVARQYAGQRWTVWVWPFLALVQVPSIDWGNPVRAVVATVLFTASGVTMALWNRRLVTAARRWLADPPGPHREPVPPAAPREVWATGGRLALVVIAALVAGVGIGLLVVLVR